MENCYDRRLIPNARELEAFATLSAALTDLDRSTTQGDKSNWRTGLVTNLGIHRSGQTPCLII